jgi:3-phosphoshikimate 1-carboxyvinyltransferase
MAMAFAPLTISHGQLTIENLDVVNKSFPNFWKEMKKIGVS